MSRESSARLAASRLTGDEILDVALVRPRGSTLAGVAGAAAGAGFGDATGGNAAAWGVAGAVLGERANAKSKRTSPTTLLALSPTTLYVLGRSSTALFGHWKKMTIVGQIARDRLAVTRRTRGTVTAIVLEDADTGQTLELEAGMVGSLGARDLLKTLGA